MLLEQFENKKSFLLYEQSPEEGESSEDEDSQEPEEFQPLKKYQLVQKLFDLRDRLEDNGIYNSDLDTLLKFASSLSYDTLVLLTDGILEFIKKQVERGQNNDSKQKE